MLSGCPKRTIIIEGKEITLAEAAKITFTEAQKLKKDNKIEEATAKFKAIIKDYPDSAYIDDALTALGNISFQAKQFEASANFFTQVVSEHPQSPHYVHAAINLGLSLAKLGRTQEALPTLQSVFDRVSGTKKKAEVSALIAESYAAANAPVEAVRWFTTLYHLTAVPGAQEAIRNQVIHIVDSQMSFTQVRQILEIIKNMGASDFPLDYIQFKLAKIFYHILDYQRARTNLETFVANWPDHPLSQPAGILLKKIIDRNRVNPDTIGVLLPLTGMYREYGRHALEGIQLGAGIFDSTSSGGPTLIIRDTAGDPDQAIKQLEDLVYNEHVAVVIGPMIAKVAYETSIKAEELEVPIITLSLKADLPKLGKYVFRNFLTFESQAKQLVSYAMEALGTKKFGLLYPNDAYGVGLINAFWNEVDKKKGEIRAAEKYEPDTKTFADPIKKLVGRYYLDARYDFNKAKSEIRKSQMSSLAKKRAMDKLVKSLPPMVDFEVLFVPDYHDQAAMIAPALAFEDIILMTEKQWKIDRIKKSLGTDKLEMIYLFGANGWNNPQLVEWAKRDIQGAIFCDGFFIDSSRPQTKLFVGKFKANFDREPTNIEAQAYDTASLLKSIITKQKPLDRRSFRNALLTIKDFPGATGDTSFSPDGEVEKDLFILTIKGDEIIEVEPEPTAEAPTG
jgi:ABC-type branched-subunit amino acid transport system substrate-binding protein